MTERALPVRARARVSEAATLPELRSKLVSAGELAVRIVVDIMETGEPREQCDAARVILHALGTLGKDGNPMNQKIGTDLPREARVKLLVESLENPDEELTEALAIVGYRRVVEVGQ